MGLPWSLVALLTISFVVRFIAAKFLFGSDPSHLVIDEKFYFEMASHLREFGELFRERDSVRFVADRTPVYPFFIATIQYVFGESLTWLRGIQSLFGTIAVLMTWILARRYCSERRALLAAVIVAFYPLLIVRSGLLLTQSIYIPLMLGFLLSFGSWLEDSKTRHLLIAGLLAGIAALTRPEFLLFPGVAIAATFTVPRYRSGRRLLQAASMFAVMFIVLLPWFARNHRLLGEWGVLQTNSGQHLWTGNHPGALGDSTSFIMGTSSPAAIEALREGVRSAPDGELANNEYLNHLAVDSIRQHPAEFACRGVRRVGYLWNLDIRDLILWGHMAKDYGREQPKAVIAASFFVFGLSSLLLLMLFAVALPQASFKDGMGINLLLIAYMTGLIFVLVGHVQYRLALTPIIAIVIASWDPSRTFRPANRDDWLRVCAAVLLMAALVANFILINEWDLALQLL